MTVRNMLLRLAALALAVGVGGCKVLDVSDPLAIEEEDVRNAEGAELVRRRVIWFLQTEFSRIASHGAELTDEYFYDPRQTDLASGAWLDWTRVDRRSAEFEYSTGYGQWQDMRLSASQAIEWLHAYATPDAAKNRIAQMHALRGYNVLMLAEHFCPGLPLNEVKDQRVVYSPPLSTDELFERARADFDSAIVYGADTTQVLHFAQVANARALLGLGRFTEAAAAAGPVPSSFTALDEHSAAKAVANKLSLAQPSSIQQSVADREGGNGLDFVAANDPRLPLTAKGMAADGVTPLYGPTKYRTGKEPVVLASGVEARLIEAEAALRAGGDWLGILNTLRATQVSPAMAALTDPGTEAARVDLLFRERAFWLFATGHRLGDLRRLIRHYGRAPESVFPTGPYRVGGAYESLTSLPFPRQSEAIGNPAVTGCTGS